MVLTQHKAQCFVHKWNSEGKGMMGDSDKRPLLKLFKERICFLDFYSDLSVLFLK